MNKLALSFATAASAFAAAMTFAPNSRADETTTTTTAPAPAAQPAQNVTVQQPAPAGQTTTTAAPYAPPPQGQEMYAEKSTTHYPNKTLLSTGVGLFVLSYAPSAIAGAVSPRDEDKNLFIPLVGPWMDLSQRNAPSGRSEDVAKGMIITSGIVQGAGVLLGLGSLVIPESTTTTEKSQVAQNKPEVHVLPVSFGAGAGVGAVGRF
ncbi:MAG TPA: hypothetical protein VIF62_32035 [Labilithrix sp.]